MIFILAGITLLWIGLCSAVFGLGGVFFGFATTCIVVGIIQVIIKRAKK